MRGLGLGALLVVVAFGVAGCGDGAIVGEGGGAGGGGAAGGGTGTGGGSGTGGGTAAGGGAGFDGLPCEVANVLATHCVSCHGAPLTGGANVPLLSRADLIAASPFYAGQTNAQRCVTRMGLSPGGMPPVPLPAVPAADIAAFDAWVTAGMPAGSCDTTPDAGMVTLTCTSGRTWNQGNNGSFDMNPGQACVACHLGQNFNGQNPPPSVSQPEEAWFFMGTVYPALNERDRCDSRPPPGVRVEILDMSGNLIVSMTPSPGSGNFASNDQVNRSSAAIAWNDSVPLPYRARVVNSVGDSLMMTTPQTSGDCNTCHTERGLGGAAGRIVYPIPAPVDSGAPDAGVPDAGMIDAGMPDSGMPDAGAGDAGADDAGLPLDDAGLGDAGADAGLTDGG